MFRAGLVALVGKPNVGKSTLMNHIVGQKVSIVSDKPQTTRRRVIGIATTPEYQIAFVDTPGGGVLDGQDGERGGAGFEGVEDIGRQGAGKDRWRLGGSGGHDFECRDVAVGAGLALDGNSCRQVGWRWQSKGLPRFEWDNCSEGQPRTPTPQLTT